MTKEEFNLALDQVLEEFGRNKFGAQRVRQGIYILEKQLTAKDEVIAEAGEMLAMRDRQLAALKAENESLKWDAEQWRAYQKRKQDLLDRGFLRSPLREEAELNPAIAQGDKP